MEWNKLTYDEETNCIDNLPYEEGEFIFSFADGDVRICELRFDCEGWYLDSGEDLSNVTAWMPKPAPYKEKG